MFHTLFNILASLFWIIKTLIRLFIFLTRLSWKLILLLVFLDGFYKLLLALHKLCQRIAVAHISDKRSVYARDRERDSNVLNQSCDDISVVSEMSSLNTSEEYVVESWNSYQVNMKSSSRLKTLSLEPL